MERFRKYFYSNKVDVSKRPMKMALKVPGVFISASAE
jgi:hypothetical protein